jgi:6-phosphogluconolactonase
MPQRQIVRWREFDDQLAFEQASCDFILAAAAQAINAHGAFRIVLAGGNTPRDIYRRLCVADAVWAAWQVYFGDERCLPAADAGRNSRMARSAWLERVAIPAAQIHAIPAELGPEAGAEKYRQEIAEVGDFDLVLLGLGEDGHTASLFPGNPATEQNEIAVPVFKAPKPPAERVSLGMVTLNAARKKIFLVAGKEKRKALGQIARGAALPAARVAGAEWHVDRTAVPDEMLTQN